MSFAFSETEKQKNWLVTALIKKGCAIADKIIKNKEQAKEQNKMMETAGTKPLTTVDSSPPLPGKELAEEGTASESLKEETTDVKHVVIWPQCEGDLQVQGISRRSMLSRRSIPSMIYFFILD